MKKRRIREMFKRNLGVMLLTATMLVTLFGCSSPAPKEEEAGASTETEESGAEEASAEEETSEGAATPEEAVVIIEGASIPNGEWNLQYLQEQMPDVNFVSKTFDNATVEKTIKTAFTAGESVDLALYWPNQMQNFISSDMALDLTPYLEADPEWRDSFIEGTLDVGTYDGKVYAIPESTVYPLVLINNEIFEEAGLEVKEQWTWDEFMEACDTIAEKTDAFPFGIHQNRATWLIRNGLLQVWDSEEEINSFIAGEIPFTDPKVVEVFDNAAALYNQNYCYPGEGAVTATPDAVLAAFSNGDIAMMADVNAMAKNDIESSGLTSVSVVGWPNMGSSETDYTLGGSTGYFIPSNVKNPDFSVELLKMLTSSEVLSHAAENGNVVPIEVEGGSDDPNAEAYARDAHKVYGAEVTALSTEVFDNINKNQPANYLFYGEEALAELDALRLDALEQ